MIPLWGIKYAGNADQGLCCTFLVSDLSESKGSFIWVKQNLLTSSSPVKSYFQKGQDIPICTSCCLVTASFPQGPWKATKEGCVLYCQSSCCFLVSFEIRTVRVYLNKALIHAQTHSMIPLLNPSIGWDKDMMTI